MRQGLWIVLGGCLLLLTSSDLRAQTGFYGASDAPEETVTRFPWARETRVFPSSGLSLIERQLRILMRLAARGITRGFTFHLEGRLRTGIFGLYRPDVDEYYDLLRLVRFIRYRPPPNVDFHLRLGPITRMKAGSGHLFNFYRSTTAWDERRVGVEMAFFTPFLQAGLFTDDVRLHRVAGVSLQVQPLRTLSRLHPYLRTLELGIHLGGDRLFTARAPDRLLGYHIELSTNLLEPTGDFFLRPYFSYARYLKHGQGMGLGIHLGSPNLAEWLRFHAQLTLYYNSRDFIPGYLNSFYMVQNLKERIIDADAYFGSGEVVPVGIPLDASLGGADLLHELRVLIFNQLEIWHQFRRHYGSQRLSEYHLMVFLYPRRADRLRLAYGFHRTGLTDFFSIFSHLRNQHTQTLEIAYRYRGNLWLSMETRYTYRRAQAEFPAFVVQRRFEPYASLRLRF